MRSPGPLTVMKPGDGPKVGMTAERINTVVSFDRGFPVGRGDTLQIRFCESLASPGTCESSRSYSPVCRAPSIRQSDHPSR